MPRIGSSPILRRQDGMRKQTCLPSTTTLICIHRPEDSTRGAVAKNIVAAINANKKCVVVAQNVAVQGDRRFYKRFRFHHRGFRFGRHRIDRYYRMASARQRSHGIPRYCFHHVQVRRHRNRGGRTLHRAYRHGRRPARIQHGESSDGLAGSPLPTTSRGTVAESAYRSTFRSIRCYADHLSRP